MAQTGLHTLIAFKFFKKPTNKNWFFYSFLLGSIIPDIDIVINFLYKLYNLIYNLSNANTYAYYINRNYLTNYNLNIFHSIITMILLYLFFLIYYEIKKNKNILYFANGLVLGALVHIFIDILFFLRPVQIFWPLSIVGIKPIDLWGSIHLSFNILSTYITLEFIFFRFFGSKLIDIILSQRDENSKYILILSKWMKLQGILFIFFIITTNIFRNNAIIYIIQNICYSLSIFIVIYLMYVLRYTINNYSTKNNSKKMHATLINKSVSIDNIE